MDTIITDGRNMLYLYPMMCMGGVCVRARARVNGYVTLHCIRKWHVSTARPIATWQNCMSDGVPRVAG
jgi:hypothetical protein